MSNQTEDPVTIRIDTGVPLPPGLRDRPSVYRRYPFKDLKVGESFWVDTDDKKVLNSLRTSCSYYGKLWNARFVVRRMTSGLRCWRTA